MCLSAMIKDVTGWTTKAANDKFDQSLSRKSSSEVSSELYFVTNSITILSINTPGPSTRETKAAQTKLQGSKTMGHKAIL